MDLEIGEVWVDVVEKRGLGAPVILSDVLGEGAGVYDC